MYSLNHCVTSVNGERYALVSHTTIAGLDNPRYDRGYQGGVLLDAQNIIQKGCRFFLKKIVEEEIISNHSLDSDEHLGHHCPPWGIL